MMLLIGLVIIIAVASSCGVAVWIARSGDSAVNREKTELLTKALAEQRTQFVDSANRIAATIGASLARGETVKEADVNRLLWPTGSSTLRFQRAYLLDGTLKAISAFPIGTELEHDAGAAIGKTMTAITPSSAEPTWSMAFDPNFGRLSVILRIGDAPYIVAASPVGRPVDAPPSVPAVVVVLRKIDSQMLGKMEDNYRLDDLHVSSQPTASEQALELKDSAGVSIGFLAWTPDTAVSDAFELASPYWLGVAFGLIALAGVAARSSLRADRKLAERESLARHEARHDTLTGLCNRGAFTEALHRRLDAAGHARTAVLYLDLDGFKEVNDTLGHQAGDQLLIEIASRFSGCVTKAGLLGRLGGDEFAVLLPGNARDAAEVGQRLVEAAQRPVVIQGSTLRVGVSVGLASAPDQGRSAEDLLRRADIALYEAKRRGGGQLVAFEDPFEAAIQARKALDRDLAAALPAGEISLVYQAIMAPDGRRPVGVEALMRWMHPVRGAISPGEFIPSAESTGFILELGAWALHRACRDAVRWPGLSVAVNLSPIQICSPDLCDTVDAALRGTGLPADRLVLEVTEGVLIEHHQQAVAAIAALQARGVRIALDDFGTGYSSLAYLKRFRFDKLKIDRSFLETLGQSADDATIVHAIISLGRGLGMSVVAEGVETAEQHRFLQAAGCHEMQGYLFARPIPAAEITRRLPEWQQAA